MGLFSEVEENGKQVRRYLQRDSQDGGLHVLFWLNHWNQTRLVKTILSCCGRDIRRPPNPGICTCPAGGNQRSKKLPIALIQVADTSLKMDLLRNANRCSIRNVAMFRYDGPGDIGWSWDYHKMINAFRMFPKNSGWLHTEHHDVINEWNGYWRLTVPKKFTGSRRWYRDDPE